MISSTDANVRALPSRDGAKPAEPVRDEPIPAFVSLLALFSIVMIRVPLLTGHSTISRITIIVLYLAGTLWVRRVPGRSSGPTVRFLVAYLALAGIAMWRGAANGVYSGERVAILEWAMVAAMAVFVSGLCASARTLDGLNARLTRVLYAPAVYVGVNILLRIFRHHLPFALPQTVNQAAGGTDEIAGLLGIQATRVDFPIALGVNNFGAVAAAGFAAAVILAMRHPGASRRVAAVAAGVCLYGVLATDSRGPLFLALAAIALFFVWKRVRTTGGMAVLLPLSPVVLLTVLGFLAGSGYANIVSRHNGDIVTGNNRLFIWQKVFGFLKHPSFEQVIGYGAYGQVTSHVSSYYAYLFGDTLDSTTFTAHNLALQTILDTGYVGLVVLVVTVVVAARSLEGNIRIAPRSAPPALLALLLVLVLSGATEALPTYIFLDTFVLFVIALAAAAGSAPLSTDRPPDEAPPQTVPAEPRVLLPAYRR